MISNPHIFLAWEVFIVRVKTVRRSFALLNSQTEFHPTSPGYLR